MRRYHLGLAGAIGIALIVSACGRSNNPSKSLKITMTDFAFVPNSFTVPAGEEISVAVQNNGAVAHSLLIMKSGHEISEHFTPADQPYVYWEEAQVAPGESLHDTFTAPAQPGTYQIICGIAGHFEAGMVASLVVIPSS